MTDDEEQLNISQAELAQWQQAMQDVTPYEASRITDMTQHKASVTSHSLRGQRAPFPDPGLRRGDMKHLRSLSAGQFAGVDKGTIKRLKRGQVPIDGRIDLHGLTQQAAFDLLERQIMQSLMHGQRLLLVITGKGPIGGGVLKNALPKWLNDERLRPYLLAFDWARREDGGSGAAYILLKKLVVQNEADNFSGR